MISQHTSYLGIVHTITNGKIDDRADKVAFIIEAYMDCIFLATYVRQVSFGVADTLKLPDTKTFKDNKSTRYLIAAIQKLETSIIASQISSIKPNDIELLIFNKLSDIIEDILYKDKIDRHLISTDKIESFLNQSVILNNNPIIFDLFKRMIKFVLSVVNQIDYNDTKMIIPCIRLHDHTIFKHMVQIDCRFNLKYNINDSTHLSKLWYRIFRGCNITKNNIFDFKLLCSTIYIDTIPNINSGLNVKYFAYEAYIASSVVRKYINDWPFAVVYNKDEILKNIMLTDNELSLEELDNNIDENEPEQPEDTDVSEDTLTGDNSEETEIQNDSDNAEVVDDTTTDPEAEEDNSSDDDQNIPEERELLLGFNVKLTVNETLDSYAYKVKILNFIDNLNEYDNDIPAEKIELLTKWKSNFLFLADAIETKQLLKKLKITIK